MLGLTLGNVFMLRKIPVIVLELKCCYVKYCNENLGAQSEAALLLCDVILY